MTLRRLCYSRSYQQHPSSSSKGRCAPEQMLRFYSKRRGTLQYVYSAANASTVQYEYRTSNRRAPYEYCSRILLRAGFRIMRGVTSSISPITSSFSLYCLVMFSFNSRIIPTHKHDVIARWRLNPYNPCDHQAECLLTSYRVITHYNQIPPVRLRAGSTTHRRLFRQPVLFGYSLHGPYPFRNSFPQKIVRDVCFFNFHFFGRFAARASRRYGRILWQTAKA